VNIILDLFNMGRKQMSLRMWAACGFAFAILIAAVPFLNFTFWLTVLYGLAAMGVAFLPGWYRLFEFSYREVERNSVATTVPKGENPARHGLTKADTSLAVSAVGSFVLAAVLFYSRVEYAFIGLYASLACLLAFQFGNISRLLLLAVHSNEASMADFNVAVLENGIHRPRFAFHFSAPDLNTPSHVLMWLPYLEALAVPFFIIVRERKHLLGLAAVTKVPIILATEEQLKTIFPPSVTTVFYANNASGNLALISGRPDLQHIQLLHGDSDKPASFSPVSKVFSKLFVAGQMAIDRYGRNNVAIPSEKFVIVGRPQVARIASAPVEKTGDKVTVAYLPTWIGYHEDSKFSSLAQAASIIDKLMSGSAAVRVLFKPHPMSHKDPASSHHLNEIRRELARPRVNGSSGELYHDAIDPIDLYNMADVLISDISSVIIDFLYSGKPYIVTNPSNCDSEELKMYPSVLGGYILDRDGDNAAELVELAVGQDPIKEKRMQTRNYAFGDLNYAPAELFTKECIACIIDPVPTFVSRVKHGAVK
jgi:hypothetical protein